jgi:hypothetical protein
MEPVIESTLDQEDAATVWIDAETAQEQLAKSLERNRETYEALADL